MTNGHYLVTEINGDWIDEMDLNAKVYSAVHPPGVQYPSDTNEVSPGVYLTADYSQPGAIETFDAGGHLLWRFAPTGTDALNKPLTRPFTPERRHPRQRRLQPPRHRDRPPHQPHRVAIRPNRGTRQHARPAPDPRRRRPRTTPLPGHHARADNGPSLSRPSAPHRADVSEPIGADATRRSGRPELVSRDPRLRSTIAQNNGRCNGANRARTGDLSRAARHKAVSAAWSGGSCRLAVGLLADQPRLPVSDRSSSVQALDTWTGPCGARSDPLRC